MRASGRRSRQSELSDLVVLCLRGEFDWTEYRQKHRDAPLSEQTVALREFNRRVAPHDLDEERFAVSEHNVTSIMAWASTIAPIANLERDRQQLWNALDALHPSLVDQVHLLLNCQIEDDQCITERCQLLKDLLTDMYIE